MHLSLEGLLAVSSSSPEAAAAVIGGACAGVVSSAGAALTWGSSRVTSAVAAVTDVAVVEVFGPTSSVLLTGTACPAEAVGDGASTTTITEPDPIGVSVPAEGSGWVHDAAAHATTMPADIVRITLPISAP
ncbi:hypothetical protein [Candidatus Poriferisodalis sp.]|uniref:hypothetical protein n=1 Tax=Candidatus Poriferisodalis sp. TaxID=3101277 RepID=UPI003AF790C7